MKRRRVVQLAALGGLSLPLAGCMNEATEGNGDADNETDGGSGDAGNTTDGGGGNETAGADGNEPAGQTFTGSGRRGIDDISLEAGLTIVDAVHEGGGDFEVRLIPDDAAGELFADASGAYDGQTARHLNGGSYLLSVVADGSWEVTVGQPRDTSGESLPLSINGDGNEVHGPFEFNGSHQPSGDYEGEKISVNVLSSTDDSRAFVFHEGSIANPAAFDFDGIGYIEIKSDGEWSLEIE